MVTTAFIPTLGPSYPDPTSLSAQELRCNSVELTVNPENDTCPVIIIINIRVLLYTFYKVFVKLESLLFNIITQETWHLGSCPKR